VSLKFDIESECYLVELNPQNQVNGKLLNISDSNNKQISVFIQTNRKLHVGIYDTAVFIR
jgi:hypothetical protein